LLHSCLWQRTATHINALLTLKNLESVGRQLAATCCSALQHTTTHCNTLQRTAIHCSTLQHSVTHCNTLQHTTTHCNTLRHAAGTKCCCLVVSLHLQFTEMALQRTATHCNTLQRIETHCKTLQHTTTGNRLKTSMLGSEFRYAVYQDGTATH